MPLAVHEANKQEDIATCQADFERQPSPESGMLLAETLLHFGQASEASNVRRKLAAAFPGNATMLGELAEQCDGDSRLQEADGFIAKALALDPKEPRARICKALRLLKRGDLDGARALASHLEEPGAGAGHDLALLHSLAIACLHRARVREVPPHEAYELLRTLLREQPSLADHVEFRSLVGHCERDLAVAPMNRLLPPRPLKPLRWFGRRPGDATSNQRATAWLGVFAALAMVAALGWNEYLRTHRKLHVINALEHAVQLRLDGVVHNIEGGSQDHPSHSVLTVAEGDHHVSTGDPDPAEFDFHLPGTGRWMVGYKPLWIVNVASRADLGVVDFEVTHGDVTAHSWHLPARPFIEVDDVSFEFCLPKQGSSVDRRGMRAVIWAGYEGGTLQK